MELLAQGGSFLLRASALLLVLFLASRLPIFRQVFYQREPDSRSQVLFTLFWTAGALLAPDLTLMSAFVPFFAGRFGGLAPGYTVGAASGAWLAFRGYSMPAVAVHVLAGIAGGLIERRLPAGTRTPGWLALAAGSLSLAGLDAPVGPGHWLPARLLGQDDPAAVLQLVYLTTAFSLASLLFLRIMEYLATEGERERARTSLQVLRLAHEAAALLSEGLSPEAGHDLVARIRRGLEVPAVCLISEGRVTAFDGSCPHIAVAEPLPEGPELDHREAFPRCPEGCPYTGAALMPLSDGLRTVAHLGLLQTRGRALSPAAATAASGLATVLSGILSQSRVLEQRAALEQARFRFLQAQIRPHFLFNALNTIASLARKDPPVRDVVLHLARFLRESFQQDRDQVPLENELEVVRSYLAIEKARFGDRLEVRYELADPLPPCQLPPFTLQPLVENAVRHGVDDTISGGTVCIRVEADDQDVRVEVEDSGPGISAEALARLDSEEGPGIGLGNVRRRLLSRFGELADLKLETLADGGARVSFVVPAESEVALESAGGR
ncbi:MAG: histidine kinase [Armatimonadetes bacterium]|nr:histidine kinase [Armatimonadota bacterium]